MALGEGVNTGEALAALLILEASQNTLDAYGKLNSLPWTANDAADRGRALKEYILQCVAYSMAYALIAGCFVRRQHGVLIVLAAAATNGYIIWTYHRATAQGWVPTPSEEA
jgi:hypothetical protein